MVEISRQPEPGLREPRLHERLGVSLAREIVSGLRPQGAVFPSSDELVREYGISRTVARETVQALASAGLIRVQHGKRTVVNGFESWRYLEQPLLEAMRRERPPAKLLRDLFEVRVSLEAQTARLCATRASDEALERIASLVDRMAELADRSPGPGLAAEVIASDQEFHAAIADASGNVVLARMSKDAYRSLTPAWALQGSGDWVASDLPQMVLECRAISEALRTRRAEEAADAMRRHIETSFDLTITREAGGANAAK